MDILAAMFAYLVCVAGVITGLAMSFVVFFAAPGGFSPSPTGAVAMLARSSHAAAPPVLPVKTVADTGGSDKRIAAATALPAAVPPVAIDARQKPLYSHARLRRLAVKQHARQLAYREHSSFETRFLHFDD